MVLSTEELRSLVELRHRSPHQVLGMHPLGDGSGIVVRAFIPGASRVGIEPTHEKNRPALKLQRIHDAGVFEGVSTDPPKRKESTHMTS
jgi:1,4-alpha-glucan branching enzyme